jgi:hypothetical protein
VIRAKLHKVDAPAVAFHVAEIRFEGLLGEDETDLTSRAQKSLL